MKSFQLTTMQGESVQVSPFGMATWGTVIIKHEDAKKPDTYGTRIIFTFGATRDVMESPGTVTALFDAACGSAVLPIDTAKSPE